MAASSLKLVVVLVALQRLRAARSPREGAGDEDWASALDAV